MVWYGFLLSCLSLWLGGPPTWDSQCRLIQCTELPIGKYKSKNPRNVSLQNQRNTMDDKMFSMSTTQFNCNALNCVVTDASLLGGITDMRTVHTSTLGRDTTVEGTTQWRKFCITVVEPALQSTIFTVGWKHFNTVKDIYLSNVAQQHNKKESLYLAVS